MTDNLESAETVPESADDDMTWNDFTVPQLKEELTVRGLETTGKKADLVARLEKYDSGVFLWFSLQSLIIILIYTILSVITGWDVNV